MDHQQKQVSQVKRIIESPVKDIRASSANKGVLVELDHENEERILSGVGEKLLRNGYAITAVKSNITKTVDVEMPEEELVNESSTYVFIDELSIYK